MDPGWVEAQNKLAIYNSFKMKQAVILGVLHMLLGVAMSALNYIRERDFARVICVFIPEVLFLVCTFGWMDILIVVKWLKSWSNPSVAPALLGEMTNFFLQPTGKPVCYSEPGFVPTPVPAGHVTNSSGDCALDPDHGVNFLFHGQFTIQPILLLVAFASIPWLLCPMLCVEKCRARRALRHHVDHDPGMQELVARGGSRPRDIDAADAEPNHGAAVAGHHEFSEVVIHQIIHTIEYVLGCASNTASYLRLWALSLAHAQLAEVFWQFTFQRPLTTFSGTFLTGIALVGGYGAWIGVTMGVLVGMEGLSAFLHALRLHWVEFQNKFYRGEGSPFVPFLLPTPPPGRFAVAVG